MEDHDDFAFEPTPGLPEKLPEGENLLWRGSPDWRALARSAFHVRKVALYFGILLAWTVATDLRDGVPGSEMAMSAVWLLASGAVAVGILSGLAYLYARGTIYTLTTKRIVIRSGLALPVTLNLPLALVDTAGRRKDALGTGSFALTVVKPNRIAWLVLWPNARPWHFTNPQPMLRCLADADVLAPRLTQALLAELGGPRAFAPARIPAQQPAGGNSVPAGATFA
jgi:hypothetical protein